MWTRDRARWEAEARGQRNRGGWFWADPPPFPEGVDEILLRVRIEGDDFLGNNSSIVFVGPLWLLERSDYQSPGLRHQESGVRGQALGIGPEVSSISNKARHGHTLH